MVTSEMRAAQQPLLGYEEVPKSIGIAASCGRVVKVSVCRTLLSWFESVSCQSVQRFSPALCMSVLWMVKERSSLRKIETRSKEE